MSNFSKEYAKVVLSTDTKPSGGHLGDKIIESDTGLVYEWDGDSWCPRLGGIEIDSLVKSMPTTSTFHHLGHEGKVYIHSDRHSAIADAANLDILIRIPAGNTNRQVHARFNYTASANAGTLDVDLILYEGVTVSADGTPETIVSTNDAVVKSTGVLMFEGPTVTDLGNFKAQGFITGEKRSTGTKEQAVPEWILAPNGASARDYLLRAINNSGGTIEVNNAIFFYDSEAA